MKKSVFNEHYERLLSLIKDVDNDIVNNINETVNNLPDSMKIDIEFVLPSILDTLDKSIELIANEDYINLRVIDYINNLETKFFLYPFCAYELTENESATILLASFVKCKPEDDADMKYQYINSAEKFSLKNFEIPKNSSYVYLVKEGDLFTLSVITKNENNNILIKDRVYSLNDLLNYAIQFEIEDDDINEEDRDLFEDLDVKLEEDEIFDDSKYVDETDDNDLIL